MNKKADGSAGVGPLSRNRNLYPSAEKCYVYKIKATSLETIDVSKDVQRMLTNYESSQLFLYQRGSYSARTSGPLDDLNCNIRLRLEHYNLACAQHTEEVIIHGPVPANKITLYQTL